MQLCEIAFPLTLSVAHLKMKTIEDQNTVSIFLEQERPKAVLHNYLSLSFKKLK